MDTIQSNVFLALGEPTRLGIVEMLARCGELSATEISNSFSSSASAISQHLKVLREAKVVVMEKRAQKRIYQLNAATMTDVEQWMRLRTQELNSRLNDMDRYVQTIKSERN